MKYFLVLLVSTLVAIAIGLLVFHKAILPFLTPLGPVAVIGTTALLGWCLGTFIEHVVIHACPLPDEG